MAKPKNQPKPAPGNAPLLIMVAGVIVVIALVAWALSRSVEQPAPAPQVAEQTPPAVDTSTFSAPPPATTTWPSSTSSNPLQITPQPGNPQPTLVPPPINAEPPASATSSVPRMAVEDLKAKYDRGEVTVIDVRDATSFAAAHIPGALHIPMASIQTELPNIPKNKPIVAYCT